MIYINKISVLHTGDLHLGYKVSFFDDEKNKLRQYELEQSALSVFDDLDGVQICLICGDVFDYGEVPVRFADTFLNKIKNNPDTNFFMVTGNHDYYNTDIISYCVNKCPLNLHIFNSDELSFVTIDSLNVRVYGASFMQNHQKTSFLNNFDMCDTSYINILCMHSEIYDQSSPFNPVKISDISSKGFDYVALGHVHNHDKVNKINDTYYAYCGVTEGRGFDECGEKGFVLLDIKGDKILSDFIPFAKRTLHTVDVEITGKQDWFDIEQIVMDSVKSISKEDLIKIVLKGKYALGLDKQIEHLLVKLNDLYYHVKIKDESSLEIDKKSFEKDMSLRGEFIREVLNSELSEEEKEKIILVGLKALEGEDLN